MRMTDAIIDTVKIREGTICDYKHQKNKRKNESDRRNNRHCEN